VRCGSGSSSGSSYRHDRIGVVVKKNVLGAGSSGGGGAAAAVSGLKGMSGEAPACVFWCCFSRQNSQLALCASNSHWL
jgi:hypothetical protein